MHAARKFVRDLSLDAAYAAGGPSRDRLNRIEKGRGPVPNDEVLAKLENVLGLQPGTARPALLNDTELVFAAKSDEPTYTEAEVRRRDAILAVLRDDLGISGAAIRKEQGGDGFVIAQDVIDQIVDRVKARFGSQG
ncbi:helix-turn-helix transcriptional regulator [Nocardia alni]|uniref:helix-turn-helix transcriptional regulator n=1 Tax=Nocardia alni TaxID=2815723 RepID=UPI001C220D84|nr:helix-turn-helix transcriptional regulator [Nocardia alni]